MASKGKRELDMLLSPQGNVSRKQRPHSPEESADEIKSISEVLDRLDQEACEPELRLAQGPVEGSVDSEDMVTPVAHPLAIGESRVFIDSIEEADENVEENAHELPHGFSSDVDRHGASQADASLPSARKHSKVRPPS